MYTTMLSPDFNMQATLVAQTGTSATAVNGTGVDVTKYRTKDLAILVNAPVASASDTITFTVEHSDAASSGFGAVTAADLVDRDGNPATFTVVTDAIPVTEVLFLRKTGNLKRYVRVVATVAGGTITTYFCAFIGGLYEYTEEGS
ncbi:hypothetical protein KC887_05275 [Candidatus Kaiserbacteria bacterium]|nr:hypothetical protein [Candidatus Kaiserbacteria bacterium]